MNNKIILNELFIKLWNSYQEITPCANKIKKLLGSLGESLVNDHVAYRTLSLDTIGLEKFSKILNSLGFIEKEKYFFKEKNLRAKYFKHSSDAYPKFFVSEYILENMPKEHAEFSKSLFSSYMVNINSDAEIFLTPPKYLLEYKHYLRLKEFSEYLAWFYVFGLRPNHFTLSVNHLKNIASLESLNQIIKDQGYILNESGGEIKGSQDLLLEQSSTMSELIEVNFLEGSYMIPSCYFEFAKRYKQKDGQLFQGFLEQSADKIFESTYSKNY